MQADLFRSCGRGKTKVKRQEQQGKKKRLVSLTLVSATGPYLLHNVVVECVSSRLAVFISDQKIESFPVECNRLFLFSNWIRVQNPTIFHWPISIHRTEPIRWMDLMQSNRFQLDSVVYLCSIMWWLHFPERWFITIIQVKPTRWILSSRRCRLLKPIRSSMTRLHQPDEEEEEATWLRTGSVFSHTISIWLQLSIEPEADSAGFDLNLLDSHGVDLFRPS